MERGQKITKVKRKLHSTTYGDFHVMNKAPGVKAGGSYIIVLDTINRWMKDLVAGQSKI